MRAGVGRQGRRAAPDLPAARPGSARLLTGPLCRCPAGSHRRGQGARPGRSDRSAGRSLEHGPAPPAELGSRRSAAHHRPRTDASRRPQGGAVATRSTAWRWRPRPDSAMSRSSQALRMRALTRDSVGLSSGDRQRNVAGRVRLCKRGRRRRDGRRRHRHDRRHRQRIGSRPANGRRPGGGGAGRRERLTRPVTAPAITFRSNRHEELKTGLRN